MRYDQRLGRYVADSEHDLKPGDEELGWRTYTELWADLRLTRGALDALVLEGKVPFVTGSKLNALVGERRFEPDQVHYAMQMTMVSDAVARLRGEQPDSEAKRQTRAGVERIPMYSDLINCPSCNAEVQRRDYDARKEVCVVCHPETLAREAAARLKGDYEG